MAIDFVLERVIVSLYFFFLRQGIDQDLRFLKWWGNLHTLSKGLLLKSQSAFFIVLSIRMIFNSTS